MHQKTERGKSSMAALPEGLSTIIYSVSADIFNAKTDVAHQHKESSDDDDENDGISAVT